MAVMETALEVLIASHEVFARDEAQIPKVRPASFKAVGISLAICSGLFIGTSFVLKKKGLLMANVKYNEEAGEGYGYLKNAWWWAGMTLMIIGEICNFVAYSFVDAILVTPLGALSVVITTILSAIFLKERLSFVGKVACFLCIVGSIVIVLNAPEQSAVVTIQDMQSFVIAPGFLTYAGIIILACAFIAFWAGPRYGKRTMLVYLSVCSLIGGLSVVATQGLGAAIVTQIGGIPQFNQWFLYVLFVFVLSTLITEIIYLNKALNIFNAALVTPTYYVYFTSSTIVSSAILFRGFKGTAISITTVVMGFLVICAGVVLLQLSKSAKDVPDAQVFTGDMDGIRTIAEQEQPESEPKADAIRGTAAIIRRISQSRARREAAEAKRIHEDKMKDQMEPINENERVEWDGLKRRKTTLGSRSGELHRRKTLHPPLGLTYFPDEVENGSTRPDSGDSNHFSRGFMNSFRRRKGQSGSVPQASTNFVAEMPDTGYDAGQPVRFADVPPYENMDETNTRYPGGSMEMTHVYGLPPGLKKPAADHPSDTAALHNRPIMWAADVEDHARPKSSLTSDFKFVAPQPNTAKRQFSFQKVFGRNNKPESTTSDSVRPHSRLGIGSRHSSKEHSFPGIKQATEEERLGLARGDSSHMLPLPDYQSDDDEALFERPRKAVSSSALLIQEEKELEDGDEERRRWRSSPELRSSPSPPSAAARAGRRRRDDDGHDDDFNDGTRSPTRHPIADQFQSTGHRRGAGGGGGGGGSGGGRSESGGGAFI